jgi:hypothetical protein
MREIATLAGLAEYLHGVSHRLQDHGERWRPVVQTLAFEFQAALAPNKPLLIRTFKNNLGNQIRLTLRNGRQLQVTYHGTTKQISVSDARTKKRIHTYTGREDVQTVAAQCRMLARRERLRLAA